MKKIFIWAFVFCLMFGSVLGVSAAEVGKYDYNGVSLPTHYKVNDNIFSVQEHYFDSKTDNSNLTYFIRDTGGQYFLYRCDEGFSINSDSKIVALGSVDYFTAYTRDEYWTFFLSVDSSTFNNYLLSKSQIVWASDTLYQGSSVVISGDSNFRMALSEEILGVTKEQMMKTLPELGGTMNILVLCGVGCLALLVALKLFGRRSLIFRS